MINSHSEFQPLEEVILGRGYPPEYFDHIQDAEIRDCLQRIFAEIEEDFQNLTEVLTGFGVTVIRPEVISKHQFQDHHSHGQTLPPLTPRDRQGVLGTKLLRMGDYDIFDSIFHHYQQLAPDQVIDPFRTESAPVINGANNSCIFRLGRDVWFDQSDMLTADHAQWIQENVLMEPGYRFHDMQTIGHGDCVFACLRPGVLLTSFHGGMDYERDFPGWDIHCVASASVEREQYFRFREELHPGAQWWIPDKDNFPRFREYVDTYLQHWVGSIHESVFDVNCLSIDEQHVIFGCYDSDVFAYCEQHGITPILCDIRHRFFFDGSVHCCSLDIRRRGGREDYL